MLRFLVLSVMALCAPMLAFGAIHKVAAPDGQDVTLYWWPEFPTLPGWAHEDEASLELKANVLVPAGKSFFHSPAVIYGGAIYKPRSPETTSLDRLVANDVAQALNDAPGTKATELRKLTDADGKPWRCFSFTPQGKGRWEWVAYSEEGDFYLIFAVTGKSASALRSALPDFKKLVQTYKERP